MEVANSEILFVVRFFLWPNVGVKKFSTARDRNERDKSGVTGHRAKLDFLKFAVNVDDCIG